MRYFLPLLIACLCTIASAGLKIECATFEGEDRIELEYIDGQTPVEVVRDDKGSRIIIRLDAVPDVNEWCYRIKDAGQFEYTYQQPLSDFGPVTVFERNGIEWHRVDHPTIGTLQRPYYLEGSWVLKHRWKRWHRDGGTNYLNGKAFRLLADAWDAAGNHIMPIIRIEDGIYSVSVPAWWLASAVYPVVINDSQWGHTDAEATEWILNAQEASAAYLGNPPENGTINSVAIYNRALSNGVLGFWTNNAGTPQTATSDTADFASTSAVALTWDTENLDSGYAVTTSDDLHIGGHYGDTIAIGTDQAGSGSMDKSSTTAYTSGVLPNWPGTASSDASWDTSIYCNYTPAGGGSVTPILANNTRRRK